jgi:hypothetical protein
VASGVPPIDTSVTDKSWDCASCAYRHRPGTECPKPNVWLASGTPVHPGRHLRLVA